MSTKSMDWAQGPWTVQLHTVNSTSYKSLQIEGRVFPHWIISYVKEGVVSTESGGETHVARSGDVMLHPPHLPFSERSDSGGTHYWMQSSLLCSHHFDPLHLYRVSPVVSIRDPSRYESVFRKLMLIWEDRRHSFRDLKLTSGMLQLTEMILSGWEKAGSPERSEAYDLVGDRFVRLIGQMSLRLKEKLTRENLASLVRLNANYLDRAFQQKYGLTPMAMLREMRLKRAKLLLEQTEETLESIAAQCGLTDASYLCKQFKRRYGVLPGEFKEAVRKSQAVDLYGSGQ
jgi:AraC-like DNA-binding protein